MGEWDRDAHADEVINGRSAKRRQAERRWLAWFITETGLALASFAASVAVVAAGIVTPSLPFVAALGANTALTAAMLSLGVVAVPALLLYGGLSWWINRYYGEDGGLLDKKDADKVSMLRALRLGSALMPALFVGLVALVAAASLPVTWPALLGLTVLAPVVLGLAQGVRVLWNRRQARLKAARAASAAERTPVHTAYSVEHAPIHSPEQVVSPDPVDRYTALVKSGQVTTALSVLEDNIEKFKNTCNSRDLLEMTIASGVDGDALACRLFDAAFDAIKDGLDTASLTDGNSLLCHAVTFNQPTLVQKLLTYKAVVDCEKEDTTESSARKAAVGTHNVPMLDLMEKAGILITAEDRRAAAPREDDPAAVWGRAKVPGDGDSGTASGGSQGGSDDDSTPGSPGPGTPH